MNLTVLTPAYTPYVVSLEEAKAFIRVEHTLDDTLISGLIVAAGQYIENFTSRTLLQTSYRVKLGQDHSWLWNPGAMAPYGVPYQLPYYYAADSNLCKYYLPRFPLISVDAVSYIDGNNATVTLTSGTDYFIDSTSPARIRFAVFNLTAARPDAITIDFTTGYPTREAIPMPLLLAAKILIAEWYTQREESSDARGVAPVGVDNILRLYADMGD